MTYFSMFLNERKNWAKSLIKSQKFMWGIKLMEILNTVQVQYSFETKFKLLDTRAQKSDQKFKKFVNSSRMSASLNGIVSQIRMFKSFSLYCMTVCYTIAVSYTHLDVYKRQALLCVSVVYILSFRVFSMLSAFKIVSCFVLIFICSGISLFCVLCLYI